MDVASLCVRAWMNIPARAANISNMHSVCSVLELASVGKLRRIMIFSSVRGGKGYRRSSAAGCPVAGLADIPGERVAREPPLLQFGIGKAAEVFVHSCSGGVFGAGVRP